MYQDENVTKLSKISSVPYDLIIEITKITVLSSNDLLEFYSMKGRFPTVEEMNVASKVGFSALCEMTKLIKDKMVNKNNYAVYKEGRFRLVGLIMSNRVVHVPGWGTFDQGLFNLPASQEDAEKCQTTINNNGEYYNHEVGCVVSNEFDIVKWRNNRVNKKLYE